MKISDNTSIAMPMRNLISIVVAVAVGGWAYFGIVERINTLETSKQLMEADLLKKAEQTPRNLEMLMLIEHNAGILEKHQAMLDENIYNLEVYIHCKFQILKELYDFHYRMDLPDL